MLHFPHWYPLLSLCLLLIYIQKKDSSLKQNQPSKLQGQFSLKRYGFALLFAHPLFLLWVLLW